MRTLTLMLVGTMALGSASVFALACSSDPAPLPAGDDDDDDPNGSSSGRNGSGGNGSSSGDNGSSSGGNGGSSGTGSSSGGTRPCDFDRVKLRSTAEEGPYCPFQRTEDGGTTVGACALGSTCCVGQALGGGSGFHPTECRVGDVSACDDPAEQVGWQCGEKLDCNGNQVCCFQPNPDGVGTIDINRTRDHDEHGTCPAIYGAYGTRCEDACGEGKYQACQTNEECGEGKTCNVRKTGPGFTMQIGVCE